MRKIYLFVVMLFVLALSGCSKNELQQIDTPQLYFDQPRYSMIGKELEVTLKSTKPFCEDIDVPFTPYVEEDVQGKTYSISQKNFHFNKGETEARLHLTKEAFTQDVKLYINCNQAPKGYMMGLKGYTIVNVEQMYYKFNNPMSTLLNQDSYLVYLYNKKGSKIILPEDYDVEVEVVNDKSTAVLGEDFAFVDNQPIIHFAKDGNVGTLKIRKLKYRDGHNQLLLAVKEGQGVKPLLESDAKLQLELLDIPDVSGTWKLKEISNFQKMNSDYVEWGLSLYPFSGSIGNTVVSFDKIDDMHFKMTTNGAGHIGTYFNGEQVVEYKKDVFYKESSNTNLFRKKAHQFIFPSVNYSFDKDKPVVKQANVYMLINDKGELQITINEFGPSNLMKDYFDFPMTSQDAPYDLIFSKQ